VSTTRYSLKIRLFNPRLLKVVAGQLPTRYAWRRLAKHNLGGFLRTQFAQLAFGKERSGLVAAGQRRVR